MIARVASGDSPLNDEPVNYFIADFQRLNCWVSPINGACLDGNICFAWKKSVIVCGLYLAVHKILPNLANKEQIQS